MRPKVSNGRSSDFQISSKARRSSFAQLFSSTPFSFSNSTFNHFYSIRNSTFFPPIVQSPTSVKHKEWPPAHQSPPPPLSSSASSFRSQFLSFNVALLACFLFMSSFCVPSAQACDIWKASDCIGSTTTAEEELMKSDDYTKEQLYKYCDKGKAYVDCVNAKLKCCDLKPELRGALAAYDKQLEKQAWKLGPCKFLAFNASAIFQSFILTIYPVDCAGLGESNVVKYKCRTTTKATTSTSTKSTKSTMPPCQVEKVI